MAGNLALLFTHHLARPETVLYRHSTEAGWHDVTAGELAIDIARWQAAFRRAGLVPGDRIALAARNGPTCRSRRNTAVSAFPRTRIRR